jgi:hypothetical protein
MEVKIQSSSAIVMIEVFSLSLSNIKRPVRLAYQPPASSTFLSQQTGHQQSASSIFLSEQTSTSQTNRLKKGKESIQVIAHTRR